MNPAENPLFQNFQPAGQPAGVGEAIANAIENPAPATGRKKKKGGAKKAAGQAKPAKPARKRASAKPAKAAPAPKFDMLRILQATAGLKEADMPLFESLATALTAMGKPARARILPAIQKLFA